MSRYVSRDVGPFAMVPDAVVFSRLSDRAVRLYAALSRYADDSGLSYPSRQTLAARLSWSESTVDRAMRELIKLGLVKVTLRVRDIEGNVREGKPSKGSKGWEATSSLYQIISVVAAELRGGGVTDDPTSHHLGDGTPHHSSDGTSHHQRRPNESHLNENHLNEIGTPVTRARIARVEDESPVPSKRRCSFPTDWIPSTDEIASATRVGMTATTRRVEFENFRDHHVAKGSVMADWVAAWRTWCNNWVKFGSKQSVAGENASDREYLEQFA